VTVSPISAITSGTPRFEDDNDISRVLGVIAAQRLELGTEPMRAPGIQELLDERVVEIFFEDHNLTFDQRLFAITSADFHYAFGLRGKPVLTGV
jgi:hypothetical protein